MVKRNDKDLALDGGSTDLGEFLVGCWVILKVKQQHLLADWVWVMRRKESGSPKLDCHCAAGFLPSVCKMILIFCLKAKGHQPNSNV